MKGSYVEAVLKKEQAPRGHFCRGCRILNDIGGGLKFHFNNGAKSCRIHHGLVREGSLVKRSIQEPGCFGLGWERKRQRPRTSISSPGRLPSSDSGFRKEEGKDKLLLGRMIRNVLIPRCVWLESGSVEPPKSHRARFLSDACRPSGQPTLLYKEEGNRGIMWCSQEPRFPGPARSIGAIR